MGFEAPGQRYLSNWEMEQATVDGCLLVDGSSDLGGNTFSLEELVVIGTQPDSQTSSKVFCQKKSRKPEDNELDNEENKQFDLGGKGGEPPL